MADAEEAWEAAQEGAELVAEGEHEQARNVLEALIAREPSNEYAYFFLGAAHFELGHYDKALAAYVKAISLAPGYTGAMVNAAQTLRMLGRYDQAMRMANEVLKRDKNDIDALFVLGASHFAIGETAAAERYLTRLLEQRPGPELATEVHGMLQVLHGEIVPAEPDQEPD